MGSEAAHTVSIHIIAERWRHAPTEVTPQVLKSSLAVFFLAPVFLLSRHLQSSSAFIFPVCSSAPFRSSSPAFFISCQMISETSLIPRPTPSSFPPVSLALFLIAFLSLAHSYAHLAANPFSFSLSLLFLCSCHLPCLFLLF